MAEQALQTTRVLTTFCTVLPPVVDLSSTYSLYWSGRGDLNARPPAPKESEWFPTAPSFTSDFQSFQQLGEPAFRSKANPRSVNRSSFGTVLPQFGRCVANREPIRGTTLCITHNNTRRTKPAIRVCGPPAICCGFSTPSWSSPNGNCGRRRRYRWSGRSGTPKRRIWGSHRGPLYFVDFR